VSIAYHIVSIAHDGIHLRGCLSGKIPALRGRQVSSRVACHHRLILRKIRTARVGGVDLRSFPLQIEGGVQATDAGPDDGDTHDFPAVSLNEVTGRLLNAAPTPGKMPEPGDNPGGRADYGAEAPCCSSAISSGVLCAIPLWQSMQVLPSCGPVTCALAAFSD
jgi:hypothetical protein